MNQPVQKPLKFSDKEKAVRAALSANYNKHVVAPIEELDLIFAFAKPTRKQWIPFDNEQNTQLLHAKQKSDVEWGRLRAKREQILEDTIIEEGAYLSTLDDLKGVLDEYPDVAVAIVDELSELMRVKINFS